MKAIIIYNTRSGNTKELAEKMGDIFEKYGHECDVFRDKKIKKTPNIVEDYDVLTVGSPVHVWGPAFFPFRGLLKKIRKLNIESKKLICFSTSGGKNAWKRVCNSIKKRLPNFDHIGSVGCVKRKNDEAIRSFDEIVKKIT